MLIVEGCLSDPRVVALLREHLNGMIQNSPPGSVHALDLAELRSADITFWSAWKASELLGCGALKELDAQHGEIKSLRTARAHLRQGVGGAVLQHIINEARARCYSRLSLETGSGAAFIAADSLYRKFGFKDCGPFGDYGPDPFSRFLTMVLQKEQGPS